MRVDGLLGEHGIGRDGADGRRHFESQMEARRWEAQEGESLIILLRHLLGHGAVIAGQIQSSRT